MTDIQTNRRRWQLAINYAQINLQTSEIYNAFRIMNSTREHYLSKGPTIMLNDLNLNNIWLKFQEAKRNGTLDRGSVKGTLCHAYHDDTLVLLKYGDDFEIAEVFAHHRQYGTLFVGTILDGNFQAE